ncbi:hypothetical protein Ahy_B05g079651 isoform D [Arachis hypogaea]|uniref:Uncharacterized protein n=1 Tax=Arachis hypogaea TaxID=3818 RepID=A0A444ZAJ0_ARAHY|nr:hypothetical protein Ahy_B05g079651 isoform D [Arachis hypogaea]
MNLSPALESIVIRAALSSDRLSYHNSRHIKNNLLMLAELSKRGLSSHLQYWPPANARTERRIRRSNAPGLKLAAATGTPRTVNTTNQRPPRRRKKDPGPSSPHEYRIPSFREEVLSRFAMWTGLLSTWCSMSRSSDVVKVFSAQIIRN